MTHREKLEHFDRLLEARGRWKVNAKPPAFRLLWWFGFEVPPPYFLSFERAWLGVGIPMAVVLAGLLGALALLAARGPLALFAWPFIAALSMAGGALTGVSLAMWWRWQREKLELPSWEEFPREARSQPVDG